MLLVNANGLEVNGLKTQSILMSFSGLKVVSREAPFSLLLLFIAVLFNVFLCGIPF